MYVVHIVGHHRQLSAYHRVVEGDVRYIGVNLEADWGHDQTTLNPGTEIATRPNFRMGELWGLQLSMKYYYIL